MPDFVTQDELSRMVIAASNGETIVPSSPYAAKVWKRIQQQVAQIKAEGAFVDIPFDIP